jgi:hypothetical protein
MCRPGEFEHGDVTPEIRSEQVSLPILGVIAGQRKLKIEGPAGHPHVEPKAYDRACPLSGIGAQQSNALHVTQGDAKAGVQGRR